jgi:hypothetical protein
MHRSRRALPQVSSEVGRAGLEPATEGFSAVRLDQDRYEVNWLVLDRCGRVSSCRLLYFVAVQQRLAAPVDPHTARTVLSHDRLICGVGTSANAARLPVTPRHAPRSTDLSGTDLARSRHEGFPYQGTIMALLSFSRSAYLLQRLSVAAYARNHQVRSVGVPNEP